MDAAWITDIGRCVGAARAYWVVGEASVVVAAMGAIGELLMV
jgi:hypothetical protein